MSTSLAWPTSTDHQGSEGEQTNGRYSRPLLGRPASAIPEAEQRHGPIYCPEFQTQGKDHEINGAFYFYFSFSGKF